MSRAGFASAQSGTGTSGAAAARAGPSSFFYIAVGPGGGKKFGLRRAGTPGALADTLRKDRLLLLKWYRVPGWAAPATTLTLGDQATLNEQLAQLLSRGVPLVEALDVVAATVRQGGRNRIERIREMVAGGTSFADACRNVGGFDEVTIAVYRAAERTGDLSGAAKRLSESARRQLTVRGKAVTLAIYPIIVLSISVVVATLMLMFVVPRIGEALTQAKVKMPAFSKVVVAVGVWMRDNATQLGLGAAVALVLLLVLHKPLLSGFSVLLRKLPGLRGVVLAQESTRFFSVMAAMTRSGVPLAEALGVANQAVTHPKLRNQLERLRERLVAGGLLRTLVEDVTSLPVATRRLLVAADRSGDMETAFTTLSADMAEEVDRKSTRLLAALEPALIVFMFAIIGSLLMAILLPILSASRGIGR
jgi:general secretion pathway protein F